MHQAGFNCAPNEKIVFVVIALFTAKSSKITSQTHNVMLLSIDSMVIPILFVKMMSVYYYLFSLHNPHAT